MVKGGFKKICAMFDGTKCVEYAGLVHMEGKEKHA